MTTSSTTWIPKVDTSPTNANSTIYPLRFQVWCHAAHTGEHKYDHF